jgi:hypothetical protein
MLATKGLPVRTRFGQYLLGSASYLKDMMRGCNGFIFVIGQYFLSMIGTKTPARGPAFHKQVVA